MNTFAYDIGARVTLAGDVKRATSQTREYFDQIPQEAHLKAFKETQL